MKNIFLALLILSIILFNFPVFSQTENDTTALGLPGDNLSLAAVLDLFQKSKTIEDFEKSLNDEKTGINNIDLNLDEKVDFIKVTTVQKDKDFTFILQVDVTEKETQDVAVILVSKDDNGKVTMQIVGDEDLYGEDYVIEPKPAVTANPGYTGNDPVTVNVETPATVVVVESAPIVQYVYSPAYVPYYPPYYYGYYPPYFAAFTVMAVGIYRHNHYYHGGYHGGYGGTVVVRNTNNYNNYNNSRNRSNTVNHNKANGNYNRDNVSNRQNKGTSTNRSSNNMTKGTSNNRSSNNKGVSTNNRSSNNMSKGTSTTPKKSSTDMSKSSSRSSNKSSTMGSSRSRSGGSQGTRSGGSRGGGGGGRRR